MDWSAFWNSFLSSCVSIAIRLLVSALVFFIGRLLIKCLIKHFPNGKKFSHLDTTVRTFLESFIKIALNCALVVVIVSIMGIPMASVITLFATAGAAIALAVQGSFSNMMGGLMLLIFKPISVGNFITVDGCTGVVREVGIFYTVLKTGDNLTITIPNSKMTSSSITNFSREEKRRVDITLDVAYGSDIALVKETILNVIEANEKAIVDPAPFIRMTAMKESSLEFTVRVWCIAGDFAVLKSDLYEQCDAAFRKAGIEIPFNQLDVTVKNDK